MGKRASFSCWEWQNGRKNGWTGGGCHKGTTTTTCTTNKIRGSYGGGQEGQGMVNGNDGQQETNGILYRVHGNGTAALLRDYTIRMDGG
jgi:hypothetical protein